MNKLRILLLPFSALYGLVVFVRNVLFDTGILESKTFDVPIICIGNLSVGGTGKTPHCEYLFNYLLQSYQTALLSRGYKRKTKGVLIASSNHSASDIGDEPKQMANKFPSLQVAVAEKRALGIQALLSASQKPDVIVMDDAFQHRYVKPGFAVVLIDYNRPVWNDFFLPAGNLREPISSLNRANCVIITKCPANLSEDKATQIKERLKLSKDQSLYFTTLNYGKLYPLISENSITENLQDYTIIALSGIASPQPFLNQVQSLSNNTIPISFKDHRDFNKNEIHKISKVWKSIDNPRKIIITTEKDAVKLKELEQFAAQWVKQTFVQPLEIKFLFGQQNNFNTEINNYVRKNKSNR